MIRHWSGILPISLIVWDLYSQSPQRREASVRLLWALLPDKDQAGIRHPRSRRGRNFGVTTTLEPAAAWEGESSSESKQSNIECNVQYSNSGRPLSRSAFSILRSLALKCPDWLWAIMWAGYCPLIGRDWSAWVSQSCYEMRMKSDK